MELLYPFFVLGGLHCLVHLTEGELEYNYHRNTHQSYSDSYNTQEKSGKFNAGERSYVIKFLK